MLINFTDNYQMNTRLTMNEHLLSQDSETRLLGLFLHDDLSFKSNTAHIRRKAYQRMSILHNLYTFEVSTDDLLKMWSSLQWCGTLILSKGSKKTNGAELCQAQSNFIMFDLVQCSSLSTR